MPDQASKNESHHEQGAECVLDSEFQEDSDRSSITWDMKMFPHDLAFIGTDFVSGRSDAICQHQL